VRARERREGGEREAEEESAHAAILPVPPERGKRDECGGLWFHGRGRTRPCDAMHRSW